MHGYSDRINHALAFAAKHHDQQVRRGTRPPYFAQPANVAIILTRYGQDEDTVLAGILHDVLADEGRDHLTRDMLTSRVSEKFGDTVITILRPITLRRTDDDGVEMTLDERREDLLTRLAQADVASRWVCAAENLHGAASIAADVRRTVDPSTVWSRLPGGRAVTVHWFRRVCDRFQSLGFGPPIVDELQAVVTDLERLAVNASEGDQRP